MERYSEYKDSGEQWLGEIPRHWEVKRLGNFLTLFSEKGFPNSHLLSVTREKGVILRGKDDKEENHNYVPDDLSGYKHIYKGDFVINKMKSWQGSYGVSPFEGIVSPAYFTCKLHGVNKDFFSCAIRAQIYTAFFMRYSKGIRVDQWDLEPTAMKSIPFILPPLPEQSAIVAYLDRVTSQLDEAIAQQRRMIDLLNERKQIIIQHAVTKGLDPNAEMVESGVEWIGMMPKGWKCMPLKRCCSLIRTKASNNQVNRISLENIVSWKGSFAKTDSIYEGNGILYKKGDILFGKLRPYLAKVLLAESEGEALGDFWVMRPNDFVLPNYVKFIFLCYSLIELIDSTTYGAKMPRADWNANSKTLIPIPPIAVQHKICEYIDQMIDYTNSVISKNEHRISLLRERKQIIINEVVTGKVRVS